MSNMMNAASYTIYDVRNDASILTPKSSKAQLSFPPMAKSYYDYIMDMSISCPNKKCFPFRKKEVCSFVLHHVACWLLILLFVTYWVSYKILCHVFSIISLDVMALFLVSLFLIELMNAMEKVTWGYVRERTLQMKWNKQNFLFIAYYIFCASLSFIWNKTTRLNSHHTKEIAFEGLMGNAIYNSDINVIKYRLLGAWILFTFSQGHKSIDCMFAYEIIDNFTASFCFQLMCVLFRKIGL